MSTRDKRRRYGEGERRHRLSVIGRAALPTRLKAEVGGTMPTMTEVIAGVTGEQLWEVARRHGVVRLRVFGSWARGDAHSGSDLDLLVKLEPGKGLLDVIGLQQALEDLVGSKVDVLTEGGISPYIEQRILSEARSL